VVPSVCVCACVCVANGEESSFCSRSAEVRVNHLARDSVVGIATRYGLELLVLISVRG